MIEVEPGTIVVFSDVGCPWSHLAVHRLHEARRALGMEEQLAFDMRSFPLELFNERPTPRITLDAEIPVAGALDPDAGWTLWNAHPSTYPVTTLPAMEAVYAAKEQGLRTSDRLDRALRVAFFHAARCISLHHEILDVAETVQGLDVKQLEQELIDGRHRRKIFADQELARQNDVEGSPHFFLSDGGDVHNPGVEHHWEGDGDGFPVVDSDDPAIFETLVKRAVA